MCDCKAELKFGVRDIESIKKCICEFDDKMIENNTKQWFLNYTNLNEDEIENIEYIDNAKISLRPLMTVAGFAIDDLLYNGNRMDFNVWEYADIGCGNMRLTRFLGNRIECEPQGFDVENVSTQCAVTDIFGHIRDNKIPSSDSSFYVLSCLNFLHHVPEQNQIILIEEMYRILQPGGLLIFQEYDVRSWKQKYQLDHLHNKMNDCASFTTRSRKTCYRPRTEWTKMFIISGFKQIKDQSDPFSLDEGPFFNSYFMMFKK